MMSDEVLHYAYINQPSSSDQERVARRKGRTSNRDTHHNHDNRSSLSLLLSSLSLRTQAVVIFHVRVVCDGEDGPGECQMGRNTLAIMRMKQQASTPFA